MLMQRSPSLRSSSFNSQRKRRISSPLLVEGSRIK
jgi:hypothetical protein